MGHEQEMFFELKLFSPIFDELITKIYMVLAVSVGSKP